MILVTNDTVLASGNGYGAIFMTKPHQCRFCHAMHFWFINRHGATRCVSCDSDYQQGGEHV